MDDLKVLTYFAHPDDETMFLGGTLAFLAARGAEVHFICATRGEGGEMGNPPICAREDLGRVRESELRCAVDVLGGASLHFSGYVDQEVGPEGELYQFTDHPEFAADELKQIIMEIDPQVILTHGEAGEYGHPRPYPSSPGDEPCSERYSWIFPRGIFSGLSFPKDGKIYPSTGDSSGYLTLERTEGQGIILPSLPAWTIYQEWFCPGWQTSDNSGNDPVQRSLNLDPTFRRKPGARRILETIVRNINSPDHHHRVKYTKIPGRFIATEYTLGN